MIEKKEILGFIPAALFVALLLGLALYWQRQLAAGVPPRELCADQAAARIRADAFAGEHGGTVIPVLGTGSMAPFIPAAAPGSDPLRTVVAFVVVGGRFEEISTGRLVVYRAEFSPKFSVMHQAAAEDAGGWIMTGLHNRSYENRTRVTPANFIGIAARVFTWPQ